MSQVTFPIFNESLPLFHAFSNGPIDEKKSKNIFPVAYAESSVEDSTGSFYKKNYSWEYFSNELEFE